MDMLIRLWLLASLFFLILEIGHPGLLFFLSFSLGSLASALMAYLEYSFAIQSITFFGVTLVALFILRIFLKKMHGSSHQTNVYALIGKKGFVTQAVTHDVPGYVKVQGEIWLARSVSKASLQIGCRIIVVDVRGAHLIVEESITQ